MSSAARATFVLLLCGPAALGAPTVAAGTDEVKDSAALSHSGPKSTAAADGRVPPSSRPPPGTKSVVMTKKNGKKYRCHLPSAQKNVTVTEGADAAPVPRVASYLKSLAGTCFYRLEGWWTYEFCYQKSVRQFHQEKVAGTANKPETTKVTQDYTLGSFTVSPPKSAAAAGDGSRRQRGSSAAADAAKGDELREDANAEEVLEPAVYRWYECDAGQMTGRRARRRCGCSAPRRARS